MFNMFRTTNQLAIERGKKKNLADLLPPPPINLISF